MRRLSTAPLKLAFVLLMAGATFLMTGQKAHAGSCNTRGCVPAYIQCLSTCKPLTGGALAACRAACSAAEQDCILICS